MVADSCIYNLNALAMVWCTWCISIGRILTCLRCDVVLNAAMIGCVGTGMASTLLRGELARLDGLRVVPLGLDLLRTGLLRCSLLLCLLRGCVLFWCGAPLRVTSTGLVTCHYASRTLNTLAGHAAATHSCYCWLLLVRAAGC